MLIQHLPLFLPLTSSFLTTTTMFFSQPFSSSPTFPLRFRCTTFKLNKPFTVVASDRFPPFLPNEIHTVKDPFARKFAMRIQRLPVPVSFAENSIMSSCVKPLVQSKEPPIVLLHGFDSSCLEWRYGYPLLEEAGFETWAIDILGWGFCDLANLPPCDVVSKRNHFYQVDKLILIDASVYSKGTGNLATLPRSVAYAGVSLLKSLPLRLYANYLTFTNMSLRTILDGTNVGRLHCLLPWWDDATVDFMTSGGYNVSSLIRKVKQKTLIIWGENDRIINNKLAVQLHCELPDAILRQIPDCGHIPHLERPDSTIKLIVEFIQTENKKLSQCVSQVRQVSS
ncbi:alpha/beta hydrolase domain-containing protein VTE7-like isoform X2 [Cicer arietinum]|uniref:alpha/beta hydrolase domain-containing protein VTE7-like isoform X2 n=1 Tax=Cicer arietinum TaxID=3827 RepID=UPI000641355A